LGRLIVAISFIVLLLTAAVVFMTRKSGSLRKNIGDSTSTPQIEMKNFSFKVFKNGEIVSQLVAKQSHFVEPNKVEIFNNVRGYRYKNGTMETLSCQLATSFFEGRSLGEILSDSKLTRAELDGDVRIRVDDRLLVTDSTSFDMESKLLYSDLPVKVFGDESEFAGDNGFSYDTSSQVLKMEGVITGFLQFEGEIK
jgi:LPS export ABC transporter protein LptC